MTMTVEEWLSCKEGLTTVLILIFFTILLHHVSTNSPMFAKKYARRHRLTGLLMLCWLLGGFTLVFTGDFKNSVLVWFGYDVALGLLGIATAYTAATDFKVAHSDKHIKNKASGVLDEDATVTYSEMIEHVFYQGLNLTQIVFLHAVAASFFRVPDPAEEMGEGAEFSDFPGFVMSSNLLGWTPGVLRVCCGLLVTMPWAFRGRFPVNKFQDNYTQPGQDPWSFNALMYRSKKYQYIFYKHCMLHGLNASLALPFLCSSFYVPREVGFPYFFDFPTGEQDHHQQQPIVGVAEGVEAEGVHLVNTDVFRMYWLCLNLSYVMEFFMQTLVKRRYMTQSTMMLMQRLLMAAATLTAVAVVLHVHPVPALLSLALMFARRKKELSNFLMVLLGTALYHYLSVYEPNSGALQVLNIGSAILLVLGLGLTLVTKAKKETTSRSIKNKKQQ
jgi:hypothetical protein